MKKITVGVFIVLLFSSCSLFFRQNNEYASDYHTLDDKELAKKYLTLYGRQKLDFSLVRKNEAYFSYVNNGGIQIFVFSENGFVYFTPPMPQTVIGKPLPVQKLIRNGIFSISGNTFKKETVAAHPGSVYSIIEEGIIRNDTIFMQKSYQTSGAQNQRLLSDELVLLPKVKVMVLGEDVFIESKD